MSCFRRSRKVQPHTSRTSSFSHVVLPSALSAARLALSAERPFCCCSAASRSRSERSSRSKSSSRSLRHHGRISILPGRPHNSGDCVRQLFPFRLFSGELTPSSLRQPVIFKLAIAIPRDLPLRCYPPPTLKPMQRWVKGTVLDP